jgi:hypothetical protein
VRWPPAWDLVMTQSRPSKDVNTHDDRSTALEAVTRQRLVKTQQTEEFSTCCCEMLSV